MVENTVLEGPDSWSSGAPSPGVGFQSSVSCTGPVESGSYSGDLETKASSSLGIVITSALSDRDDQSVYRETGLAGGHLPTGLSGLVRSVSDLQGFSLGFNCAGSGLVFSFAAFGLVLAASGLVFVDSGLGAGLTKSGLRGTGPICT